MTRNDTLRTLLLALAVAASPAMAHDDSDEGGSSPEFTDDDLFTYVEAEADYASRHDGLLRWHVESWVGGDYRKLWLSTEGDSEGGKVEEAGLQLRYGGYLAPFWDWQVGLRYDFEPRPLGHAVLGIKGLAPYRFETDAFVYLSEDGDVSAELEAEYDLLLTQRLVAQPYLEAELFAQDVPELGRGSGLSEAAAGLRLRYEIRREIAPYLDFGYSRAFGGTADHLREGGADRSELVVRTGLRLWY